MIFESSPGQGDCESPEGAVDPAECDGPLEAAAQGRRHRRLRLRARQDEQVGRDGGRVEQQVQQRVLPDQLQHAPPTNTRGKKGKGPKLIFLCNLRIEINFLYLI